MSLLKVSDLEGVTKEQLSSGQFHNALLEVSNPVSDNDFLTCSYKSQYIRAGEYAGWVNDSISAFNHPVYFLSGFALSGNLCCNADNPNNDYFAKMYFGESFNIKTDKLSIDAPATTINAARTDLYGVVNIHNNGSGVANFSAAGISFSADVDMGGHKITNVKAPSDNSDAVNKQYVDNVSANIINGLPLSGDFGMFASCDYEIRDTLPT